MKPQPKKRLIQHGRILIQLVRNGYEPRSTSSSGEVARVAQVDPACAGVDGGYRQFVRDEVGLEGVGISCVVGGEWAEGEGQRVRNGTNRLGR